MFGVVSEVQYFVYDLLTTPAQGFVFSSSDLVTLNSGAASKFELFNRI